MNDIFSKRHGYRQTSEAEITVREDAPHELRGIVVQLAYGCGFRPTNLRSLVCGVLRKRPDQNNWSEYPNIDREVYDLVDGCEWYRVYDVIEAIAQSIRETPYSYDKNTFESEINDYFIENGIGWKIVDGRIEMRGPATFEQIVHSAVTQLEQSGYAVAKNELRESLHDLSRRPKPDITGAIQHSMAAMECVAREACGDHKATLGDVVKKHPGLIPRPLDEAVTKAWGFASENARHLRETSDPSFEEAELVVGLSCTIASYLAKKHQQAVPTPPPDRWDTPWGRK